MTAFELVRCKVSAMTPKVVVVFNKGYSFVMILWSLHFLVLQAFILSPETTFAEVHPLLPYPLSPAPPFLVSPFLHL